MVEILETMKKIIRHKWKKIGTNNKSKSQCQKCGCVKYYDFDYQSWMYQWETKITYRAPSCIIMNGKPYNSIDLETVKK